MKRFFTILMILFAFNAYTQNFYFEPTNELTKTVNLNGLSDLRIDILRESSVDTLYLEYELIINTLPSDWYQGYCDNHGCWGSLPEFGTMSACYDELNSYITLSIDPINIEGSGTVKYYIYEVGHYENGLLMTFNIQTPDFVGLEEAKSNSISFHPNPASDFVKIDSEVEIVDVSIFSLTAQEVFKSTTVNTNNTLDISFLKSGIYFIRTTDINGEVSTQKLKKQ